MGIEILLLAILILMNGVLALAEIAVVSANKSRLQSKAQEHHRGAQTALALVEKPERFLATVQIGITVVGIIAGAFGDSAFSDDVAAQIAKIQPLEPYSEILGFIIVVAVITYASLLFGELVPKTIALQRPEGVAMWIARPMFILAKLTAPLVSFLSLSTQAVTWLLRLKADENNQITVDELIFMLAEGTEAGVFKPQEETIVSQVFELNDYRVADLMIPRSKIVWLNTEAELATTHQIMQSTGYSYFPVYRDNSEQVLGTVSAKQIWSKALSGETLVWDELVRPPLYVPENANPLQLLELFKQHRQRMALVIDEYSAIQGLITLTDVMELMLGSGETSLNEPKLVARSDGSWLVDGMLDIDDFATLFMVVLPTTEKQQFSTLGGLAMTYLQRIPQTGDIFEVSGLRFEVVDMDGKRVDKLLVTRLPNPTEFDSTPPIG